MGEIYFDHAAGSFPKLPCVNDAIRTYIETIGIGPGHSLHSRAKRAEEAISKAYEVINHFLGVGPDSCILYAPNATYAINLTLLGFLQPGDHVIFTAAEHNSVIRPLKRLEEKGIITLDYLPCDEQGNMQIDTFDSLLKKETRLVICNHASNVIGTLYPVEKLVQKARDHGCKIAIDATQTVGSMPVNATELGCDFLFFTGHKSLMGAIGIGGAYIKEPDSVEPVIVGGTGGNSASLYHPTTLPERFIPGTMNYAAAIGLQASIEYINDIGLEKIHRHKTALTDQCVDGLRRIEGVTVYGHCSGEKSLPVISFNVANRLPNEITHELDAQYTIMTRSGLQCAPLLHKNLGTAPNGTVRISFGYTNTPEEIDTFLRALKKIL